MEPIGERCLPTHMGNSTGQECFGIISLLRQVDRHGSVSLRSAKLDDFFDLFDVILFLEGLREVLPLRSRCSVDAFPFDIV